MENNKKNCLINKILTKGIDSLSKAEFFEYLLILCKDTAPQLVASELDEFFNDVALALDSTPEHLLQFTSISERSAKLLTTFPLLLARIKSDSICQYTHLDSFCKMANYLFNLLHLQQVEQSYIVVLDSNYKILKCSKIAEGTLTSVEFTNIEVVRKAINLKRAKLVILAHNHPDDAPHPSILDVNETTNLTKAFYNLNIKLIDHIIVGKKSIYSMNKQKYFHSNFALDRIVCPVVKKINNKIKLRRSYE